VKLPKVIQGQCKSCGIRASEWAIW